MCVSLFCLGIEKDGDIFICLLIDVFCFKDNALQVTADRFIDGYNILSTFKQTIIMEGFPLDLNINKRYGFDYLKKVPSGYRGLLLPETTLEAIYGDFGQMVFQGCIREKFSIWYNDYNISDRLRTHARWDKSMIEFTMVLESETNLLLNSFGRLRPRNWQCNLMYSTHMDSQVQFESGTHAISLDVHLEIAFLEELYEALPDLVGPFLDAVLAGKPTIYFPQYVYATPEMVGTAHRILQLLKKGNDACSLLLENLVSLLVIQAMMLKGNRRHCNMRYDQVLQIRQLMYDGVQFALSDFTQFKGEDACASYCAMSATTFKKYMRIIKGKSIKQLWQNARTEPILNNVLCPDKPLTAVAYEFGFPTMAAFRGFFKDRFGLAPRDVRTGKYR